MIRRFLSFEPLAGIGPIWPIGDLLKAERQIEKLSSRVKRSFYAGRPTRKYRRLIRMQNSLNAYLDSPAVREMLRK